MAPPWLPEGWSGAVVRLVSTEAAGGVGMTVAVVAALIWANLAPASYAAAWSQPVRWFSAHGLTTVGGWVDNGLMTVFFLGVGLEVGRERTYGSLRGHNALLPVVAAAGGMAGAALAYVATVATAGDWSVAHAWGVPMATDVAFVLGAMALLGRRVPPALRVFVLALAVADDVGSVIVLAVVSSSGVHVWPLVGAVAVLVAVVIGRRWVPVAWWPYVVAVVAVWYLFVRAGVEPTLAGAFVGMAVPCRAVGPSASSRLEGPVAPVSILGVLPLFVLANAGIVFAGLSYSGPPADVLAGVLAARIVGKAGGITLATALVAHFSVADLPSGVRWRQLVGAAALCGMGFTVPLLFAAEAFAGQPRLLAAVRLGLLVGTLVTFAAGALVLARSHRRRAGGREAGTGPGPAIGAGDPPTH